jgi:starch synthase
MKILMAASEMAPFAKTGGLGDVLGALPEALAAAGHEVLTFIPRYQTVNLDGLRTSCPEWTLNVPNGDKTQPLRVALVNHRKHKLTYGFVVHPRYFDRSELYLDPVTGKDFDDNDMRFAFFSRGVLMAAHELGFQPDIIHCHDWQTALIPVFMREDHGDSEFFKNSRTVLTIHNLAHQGTFDADRFASLGLDEKLFAPGEPLEFYDQVNFLKGGICYADKITTVSPRYADEIKTGKFGCGLDGVLKERATDLTGVLNGVDYTVWSPSRDKMIPYRYHPANLGGKKKTRVELMNRAGLPIREKVPLIGMVTRLAHQKGLDLIEEAADRLMTRDLQMIVLGTGEERYHKLFTMLQEKYPDRMRCFLRLDESLAHFIEAGSDMFLMPSLFEPCGLNQIYSLKYGTVPIVHKVGGLADTIIDYDPDTGQGTGFVFDEESPEALLEAVDRAQALFVKKRKWGKLVKNGMRQDFSWDDAVQKYTALYLALNGSSA